LTHLTFSWLDRVKRPGPCREDQAADGFGVGPVRTRARLAAWDSTPARVKMVDPDNRDVASTATRLPMHFDPIRNQLDGPVGLREGTRPDGIDMLHTSGNEEGGVRPRLAGPLHQANRVVEEALLAAGDA
jgi:hypothetical protein